jgi:hypothetical protein
MGKFKPGQSGNPRGRPLALRGMDSRTLVLLKAESLGRGAATFLCGVYNCEAAPDQLRATCAIALLPYENVRCSDRRVSRPLDMPKADTVELALANIAELKDRAYKGALGLEEATLLIQMEEATIRAFQDTLIERDVRVIEGVLEHRAVTSEAVVSGGLPTMPLGENDSPIIMPNVDPPANDPNPWTPKDEPK